MALPYTDGDFTTAQPDGPPTIDRPFLSVGDPAHIVTLEPFAQNASDYTPLGLDTAHPTISGARLVNEVGFRTDSGGIKRWFREYATIPASRIEPDGTEAVALPGLTSTPSGPAITINSVTQDPAFLGLNVTDAEGLTVGDIVFFSIKYQRNFPGIGGGSGTLVTSYTSTARVLSGSTSTQIRIPAFFTFDVFISGTVFESFLGRSPLSRITSTVRQFDYYLPGVTPGIDLFDDIPILQPFEPANRAGGNSVNRLTETTTPTSVEYRDFIVDGTLLVLSCDVKRYKGNIVVRETRFFRAQ